MPGCRGSTKALFLSGKEISISLSETQSSAYAANAVYRPRGVMLWLQIFIVTFFSVSAFSSSWPAWDLLLQLHACWSRCSFLLLALSFS